ncbi:hypothetical protein KCV87_09700 [Actinosynnema pretiosum subsp. pretiosum]|uniref:Uncharacterized protein n=2 Tax=Actinosynnema TaxID=40566 RepID=C6WGT8_ACTMD|nr:hypothetical protein [Actinosynnema mirum]ACU36006.1 hypothetical protein Amir_2060 [Actinosynnema mirum DSM 43827]AXX29460.1 hypothetical protein APASM_2095 [Actinosynnema pretiosum subsp. pretiosum]QUF06299.1 hypothetical protein KCV87_09700 [Actinosynnema pretiosum subsp. pretiosum]
MPRRTATLSAALALTAGALLAAAPAASAIPPAGPGESVTITYYSDATRTVEVGWWSYGSCGEPFDYGTHTRYSKVVKIRCGTPDPL